jgi:short-subunit dehydrogenase
MEKAYAIITGASSGIGYEMADILAAKGYPLILVARREDRLQKLKAALSSKYNCTVEIVVMDLSEKAAANTLHKRTNAANWEVEILINNAGFGMQSSFLEQSMERMSEMVHLNAINLTHLTQLYAQDFIKKGGGKILQVASAAAFVPTPFVAAYAATKAYVRHLSDALHYELKGTGVTLTTLYPGFTATEFAAVSDAKTPWIVQATQTTARDVATAGINAMLRGKKMAIPGAFNKVSAFFTRVLPQGMVVFFTGKLMGGATISG